MEHGLRLNHFFAGYPKCKVIEDFNIPALPRGKITVLLGPNGCGKSTLLSALAGLTKRQGEMWLNGEDLMKQPFGRQARRVIYLPQTIPVGVHLYVLESIIVAQRSSGGWHNTSSEKEIMKLLEQLGIAYLAMRYLDQLSGGQKQLVGLAQSLIRHPELLLLDEPLSALDLHYQLHVLELIQRETYLRNIVTVVAVHDINIALRYADHVLMIKAGNLLADGVPSQVITPKTLAQVYGVRSRIENCSHGMPQVIIDGLVENLLI